MVKRGRGDRLKKNADTGSGLHWNGQQALEMGLIDHLGSLDHVAREVVKAEEVIDHTPHENVAERLAKRFGARSAAAPCRPCAAPAGCPETRRTRPRHAEMRRGRGRGEGRP